MIDRPAAEPGELEEAQRAFYRAFEALDARAMGELWLDDPGVKCVHPGWRVLQGWQAVMESWRAIFAGTTSVRFELAQVDLRRYGSFALATCEERLHLVDAAGERRSALAATNAFLLRDGRWRMVLHHASPTTQLG